MLCSDYTQNVNWWWSSGDTLVPCVAQTEITKFGKVAQVIGSEQIEIVWRQI